MKDNLKQQKSFYIIKILLLIFFFFGFSIALFAYTFIIKMLILLGFILYNQTGIKGVGIILSLFIPFILQFFPIYLIIKFIHAKFYIFFSLPEKYKTHIKTFLYFFSYLIGILIYKKLVKDFDDFLAFTKTYLVDITIFIVILALDFLCEKIYQWISYYKDKFKVNKNVNL